MSNVTKPIINLNGTSRDALMRGYREAIEALHLAHSKVAETAPHGRDYPGDEWQFRMADTEHRWRAAAIRDLINTYQDLVEFLS